jgi:hypothetical protein
MKPMLDDSPDNARLSAEVADRIGALEAQNAALVARDAELAGECARSLAMAYVLTARVGELEASNRELRAALGLDPPKPSIGPAWKTVGQVAGETGYSEPQVRKWIRGGTLAHRKVGGRVLVDASLPLPRRRVRKD